MTEPLCAPSGRPLSRNERHGHYIWDPDLELRYLMTAYAQNYKQPPPLREWCDVCRNDFSSVAERAAHDCPGRP